MKYPEKYFSVFGAYGYSKFLEGNITLQELQEHHMFDKSTYEYNTLIGYYYSKCKSNGIPFKLKIDIPEKLTVSESDICLVIANLLENAFEASMKLDRDKRQIKMYARPHSEKILLISVENAFNGEITEKDGFFGSSKRNGNGIGTQSVRRIAEKDGGYCRFSHENGIFTADIMLHGKN